MSKHVMRNLLKSANRVLLKKESEKHLKASMTVVITDYRKMRYGYVGNTRLRMYRGSTVYKQTQDMSLAQELLEEDKIAQDELMRHEERNNLYAYLGQKNFRPFLSKQIKLEETDIIALYTRGIWENIDEAELDDAFADAGNEGQKTVDDIEDLLLSRQPENLDNYTLAVIFVNKVYQNPQRRKRIRKIIILTVIAVIAVAAIGAFLWFLHHKKVQRIENMNYHFTNTVEYINTGNYVRAKEECQLAQELAEKLKDHNMRNRLQEYSFVIETVILADESYSSKDYETANEYYLSALDRTRYADHVGTDYIEDRLDKIGELLSVEDYIALGDTLMEQQDYEAAEEKYLLAKKTATAVHDAEGKQNAMDALESLYAEMAEAESQAKEQVAAAETEAAGDTACMEKDYVGARVYYTTALAKYESLGDMVGKQAVQGKLEAVEQKLQQQEEQKNMAASYETQGENCRKSGDFWGAKSQYVSAKSIYQQLQSDEDVSRIEGILNDIDIQIGQTAG